MKRINRQDCVLIEELVQKYGKDELLEFNLPKKSWPYITAAGLALGGLMTTNKIHTKGELDSEQDIDTIVSQNNPYGMSYDDYELFKAKVDSMSNEIDRVLNLHNKSVDDIKFDIELAVLLCYEYDFDLPLMIAQMQYESHFGTTPRAQRTNSIFSVGLWDNKTMASYQSQNDCLIPYIKLIQNDYLQNGDVSIDELLSNGGFVNTINKRYASDPNYEKILRGIRNNIIKQYPVLAKPFSSIKMKNFE